MKRILAFLAVALLASAALAAPPVKHHKVPAAPRLVGAASCVVAAAGAPLTITLAFVPPTLNTDGSPITLPLTYNVLMGTASGAETSLATGITASPYSINAGLVAGNTYYVEMSAQDTNGVGPVSNEGCKAFGVSTPVITTTALPGGVVGAVYSFHVLSSGGVFNAGITPWAATGLPAGLVINSGTGVISGAPTAAGTSSVTITVTDSNKATSTVTLPLVVSPAPVPGSFVITLT